MVLEKTYNFRYVYYYKANYYKEPHNLELGCHRIEEIFYGLEQNYIVTIKFHDPDKNWNLLAKHATLLFSTPWVSNPKVRVNCLGMSV